jgi:hypothetical protein
VIRVGLGHCGVRAGLVLGSREKRIRGGAGMVIGSKERSQPYPVER